MFQLPHFGIHGPFCPSQIELNRTINNTIIKTIFFLIYQKFLHPHKAVRTFVNNNSGANWVSVSRFGLINNSSIGPPNSITNSFHIFFFWNIFTPCQFDLSRSARPLNISSKLRLLSISICGLSQRKKN